MLGSYDDDEGAQLYMIDPSGVSYVSILNYICLNENQEYPWA